MDSDSIVFPCDTPEWDTLKQKLNEARNVAGSSSRELIAYLQTVTASLGSSFRVHESSGARPKTRNVFVDLKHCVDDEVTAHEDRDTYLTRLLLHVVDRAVEIEIHASSEDMLTCRHHRGMQSYQGCCCWWCCCRCCCSSSSLLLKRALNAV